MKSNKRTQFSPFCGAGEKWLAIYYAIAIQSILTNKLLIFKIETVPFSHEIQTHIRI